MVTSIETEFTPQGRSAEQRRNAGGMGASEKRAGKWRQAMTDKGGGRK